MFLLKMAFDVESRLIIAAAKEGKFYREFREWAVRTGRAKKSTLADRKQALMEKGLISHENIKRAGMRGRPRMRLFINNDNRKNFEALFGKPI